MRAVHPVALEAVQAEEFFRHQPVGGLADIGFRIEHVEHLGGLEPRAFADLEIVEIVPGGDLHRAAAQFGIGMFVGHDRHAAAGDRQDDMLADDRFVALVIGMYRHRHVGEHGFGARGRDLDMVAPVGQSDAILEWVAEMPERALHILRLDLEVGDRGLELGVPIYQPLVAVDQPVVIKVDEGLEHGIAEMLVHGELFAAPVHRTAEAAQLARDRAAAFLFPLPHLGDEILAAVIGALVLLRFQLAFDDHLRGDARMVGAHHPQRVLAAQPLVADHDILQRVVERVADMQAAGDVGRRVDDRIGLRVGAFGAEQALVLPMDVPARLDFGGIESFG